MLRFVRFTSSLGQNHCSNGESRGRTFCDEINNRFVTAYVVE